MRCGAAHPGCRVGTNGADSESHGNLVTRNSGTDSEHYYTPSTSVWSGTGIWRPGPGVLPLATRPSGVVVCSDPPASDVTGLPECR